jgi:hypothetical protein
MRRLSTVTAVMLVLIALFTMPAQALGPFQASGKLTFLRAHDVGTGWGPETDFIDVEVVIRLDSKPDMAFGFKLRNDSNRPVRQGMLDLLRDAFKNNWTVTIDYELDHPDKKNGVIIRTWLTSTKVVKPPPTFQYTVKFVCGKATSDDGVAPGLYYTAINVHNPWDKKIEFKKKFAVALPLQKSGRHTDFFDVALGEDEALEIDHLDIFERTNDISSASFRKGFAVIESPAELDVVAVYTAANFKTKQVITQHIEQIRPRRLFRELPDLLPIPDETGSFCVRQDNSLVVTIKNQGSGPSGLSKTEVDFFGSGKFSIVTPEIAPDGERKLLFEIPPDFLVGEGSKQFKITADVLLEVTETNEGNNVAIGTCIIID